MKESVVIVGGGIAGLSLAMRAANVFDVTVLEAEFQPGYHSTGRSAAVLHIPFENDVIHRLTLESLNFFRSPPTGFESIAAPLSTLRVGTNSEREKVENFLETWKKRCPWLELVSKRQILNLCPILSSRFTAGIFDSRSLHLDVHQLLTQLRRAFVEAGGTVRTNFRVSNIEEVHGGWRVNSDNGDSAQAEIIVNAAGAWLDEVARLANVQPVGVRPKRRTGIRCRTKIFDRSWPMCYLITHGLYFKPEGTSIMLSPCDATASEPCDAQPEVLDVATAMARFEQSTTLTDVVPDESWAGLRVFVPDECPLIGFDKNHEGFFWYGAFGGFGVQTSPACSKIGAQLLQNGSFSNSKVMFEEVRADRFTTQDSDTSTTLPN